MEYMKLVLPNGIRAIHKEVKSEVAHIAIMIDTGTRDEDENEAGMAHFIEHMLFKGTKRRKPHHINNRLDTVGGEINAYTTKEETCLHTTSLNTHYQRALELITDVLFNSVFPEHEIKKEREVIIDEINSYKDSPSELIYDDFEELIYSGHALGNGILSTPEALIKIDKKGLLNFIKKNYLNENIVVASIGSIKFKQFERWIHKYFGDRETNVQKRKREKFTNYRANTLRMDKNTHQAHCIYGNIAYSMHHKNRTALALLNNIVGGPGLNSRLNNELREKNGLVYSIESNYVAYSDTGHLYIYFGTDKSNMERSMKIVRRELKKLRNTKLTPVQLQRAKRQLMGQIAIAYENNEAVTLSVAKNVLHKDKYYSLEDIFSLIQNIDATEIIEVANNVFCEDTMTTLIYQ